MADPQVLYQTTPAYIVNQAVDRLGVPGAIIGAIDDGTPVAEAARRVYGQALRQLLNTAHWDFARKRAPLTLLGDATGFSQQAMPWVLDIVEQPWTYAYAWPIDGVQGRWMPWTPNNGPPVSFFGETVTTAPFTTPVWPVTQPARFLVASSDQYPYAGYGQIPWDQQPDLRRTHGVGPNTRKIILSDCGPPAEFVYTRLVVVIEEWDRLFREAMVMMMALAIAPTAIEDPKIRFPAMDRIVPELKSAIADARVANGNESGMPQTVDHQPVWMTARSRGWSGATPGFDGAIYTGYTYYPWDSSMSWCGSVF